MTNTVSVLLGNGNGTFKSATSFISGRSPYSLGSGDFNNDNKLDLAVVNSGDNTVSVLLGNGDGTFQARKNFAVGGSPLSDMTVDDFNNDNMLDVAVS